MVKNLKTICRYDFDILVTLKKVKIITAGMNCNTAMTLKYGHSHWKWYDYVKHKVQYQHVKFHISHIYGVWANPNVKVFNKPTLDQRKTFQLPLLNTHVTQIILCIIFFMYVATIQPLKCRGQDPKTCNLQLKFLTHLWPWNKSRSSNLQWQCRPQER